MTRRLVMFNRVSADGYFASPGGALDWVVPDDDLARATSSDLSTDGTMLLGRRTYEMFASFWPHAADEDPHAPGQRSPSMRAFADWLNAATKYVYSTTLHDPSWRNTHVLRAFDAAWVEQLKGQPGSDIMVFGSGTLVSQLTAHALIDEYQLVVGPVVLGAGRSLVTDVGTRLRLSLVEATPYPTGNVMLRYVRA